MKNKKAIELLEKLRADVLPKAPQEPATAWQTWASNLRDAVTDNLGRDEWDAKKTWDYDPYSGTFYFSLKRSVTVEMGAGQRQGCSVEGNFSFDPKLPLPTEIERLSNQVNAWSEALNNLRRLQLEHLLKTEGKEALLAATQSL